VLDCSLTMAWFFEDEATAFTDALFSALPDSDLHVAVLWPLEVSNVLMLAERKGRTTQTKIGQFVDAISKQPILIDRDGLDRAFTHLAAIAKRRRLTIYDAAYLELAIRAGLPLATLDKPLQSAAVAEGVELVKTLCSG
jgi:predicted nucleic acid-binding protein